MKFKNTPNRCHSIYDAELGTERLIWESRSVAVNGVVVLVSPEYNNPLVLVSKRGLAAADCHGFMNAVAGYIDWDETGGEGFLREAWEETGLDIMSLVIEGRTARPYNEILRIDLDQPWYVKTEISENRQNISLWYGVAIRRPDGFLPPLSIENNEVPGEVEYAIWMSADDIANHLWAFSHDKMIMKYIHMI
jgi:8-oxo-dGTP pyrophosphatase MutT (NUDIX family)